MKKNDLKKRIKDLEELVEQKNMLIQQLQFQLQLKNDNPVVPLFNPFHEDLCWDGKEHEYPTPWLSVTPPHCKKCGKVGKQIEVTFQGDNSGTPIDFNQFGGNMIYS